ADKMADKIVAMITKNNYITIQELADSLKLSKRTIERHIKRMQETNIIIRIGSKKGGYWSVNTLKESDEI
ncbi:HTH domain-containing protein, partial [Patescibacteria group bacterium]|nr:HTH domain-containing protein [Patescibacteria group bacterium]